MKLEELIEDIKHTTFAGDEGDEIENELFKEIGEAAASYDDEDVADVFDYLFEY